MATYYYGANSYAMFGIEAAWGTGVTADLNFGKIRSISIEENDNPIRENGVGEGRDQTDQILGPFDATGTISFWVRDGTPFPLFWGDVKTTGGPNYDHAVQKADGAGDLAIANDLLPSCTLEVGKVEPSGATDNIRTYVGVRFMNARISYTVSGQIECTADFVAKLGTIGTTAGTYNPSTAAPKTSWEASMTWDGDTVVNVESFSFALENNLLGPYRQHGSRFIIEQMPGPRRHNFSIVCGSADNAAYTGMQQDFYGQAVASGPIDGSLKTSKALVLTVSRNATNDKFVLNLAVSYLNTSSEPVEGLDRVMWTVNGSALSSVLTFTDLVADWYA